MRGRAGTPSWGPAGLLAALLAGACAPSPDGAGDGAATARTAERDGVTLSVRLSTDRAVVGEPLGVVVEAAAPEGVDVTLPDPPEELGAFRVVDVRRPPGVPDGASRRWRHTWEIETFEAGELELPAVSISFVDRRGDDDDGSVPLEQTLTAAAIPVTVESVLADAGERELRDIRGFVDLPSTVRWWLWLALAAVLVTLALFLLRRLGRTGERGEAAVVVPPEVWARAALDALAADDLPARGEVHGFFFRLSAIVREYIERRFGIDAPDRTTEEFIREMRGHPVLADRHQELLRGFLRSADMVKFALHRPPVDECGRALATARSFVEETTPVGPTGTAREEAA